MSAKVKVNDQLTSQQSGQSQWSGNDQWIRSTFGLAWFGFGSRHMDLLSWWCSADWIIMTWHWCSLGMTWYACVAADVDWMMSYDDVTMTSTKFLGTWQRVLYFRCVDWQQKPRWYVEGQMNVGFHSFADWRMTRLTGRCMWCTNELRVRFRRGTWDCHLKSWWRVGACMLATGDWIFGFCSQEAKEHVCVVGFLKGRLDLHRSEIGQAPLKCVVGSWIWRQGSVDGFVGAMWCCGV